MYIKGVEIVVLGLLSTGLALDCFVCSTLNYSKSNVKALTGKMIVLPTTLDGRGTHRVLW